MLLDITAGSVQTAATPDAMLAVVSGFKRTVNYGVRPAAESAFCASFGAWAGNHWPAAD